MPSPWFPSNTSKKCYRSLKSEKQPDDKVYAFITKPDMTYRSEFSTLSHVQSRTNIHDLAVLRFFVS